MHLLEEAAPSPVREGFAGASGIQTVRRPFRLQGVKMKVAAREQPPADDFTEMRFCLRASCVRPAPPPLVTPDQLFSSALESFT